MGRMLLRSVLSLALFLSFGSIVFAGGGEGEGKSAKDDGIKFKGGIYERARYEYWRNWRDMNNDTLDNRSFFRFKTSLWGQVDINKNLGFYGKLTNENKVYDYYAGAATDKSATKKGYHYDPHEVVFDNLYADVKEVAGLPVNLRIGRQDLAGQYGEDFLIADGTPQDGSRTFYFNAVKASWTANDENTLDFVYMIDPRTDEYLPVINEAHLHNYANPGLDKVNQPLNTTDENGYMLYWKNKSVKDLSLEPYYIYKQEDNEGGTGYQSRRSIINTMGTYAKYKMGTWTIRSQLAGQFGSYGEESRSAMGGYTYFDKNFPDVKLKPTASIGYIYLSGDNPGTTKNEGWDPLFSRYPWISELYNLSMVSETGILAYWTNLGCVRTNLSFITSGKSKLNLWYNYMLANETIPASTVFSGKGKERGHLFQGKFDYAITKNINTYVMFEYLIPGSVYKDKSHAAFLRTQLELKF